MRNEETTQSSESIIMPLLPDGIGMNLDQVAALLAEKHKTIVSKDDPLLMVVTVMNAFLAQENALMDRHKQALTMVMADKSEGFMRAAQKAVEQTGEIFASATVESMKQAIQGHHKAMDEHRKTILWLSALITLSALINVLLFIWK